MAVRYLLETNICIYIAKHNPPGVRARFESLRAGELPCPSSPTVNCSSARDQALTALERLRISIQARHAGKPGLAHRQQRPLDRRPHASRTGYSSPTMNGSSTASRG